MQNKIRIGIVGASASYGWAKDAHMPALLSLPEFQVIAVCTAHIDTANDSRQAYGAKFGFHNYEDMIKHPEIDVISVSVRAPLHYPIVMAALAAGKHVYCEWPLGVNTDQAKEMASLAERVGVTHMVGLQAQCDPSLIYLKELINGNYIGRILTCRMTMSMGGILRERDSDSAWMADAANGANTLSISTGHAIDALCFCMGEFIELSGLVSTQVKKWPTTAEKQVDVSGADDVAVHGVLDGGALASIHIVTIPWHGSGWALEIYGTDGTLFATSDRMIQYFPVHLLGGLNKEPNAKPIPIPDRLTWIPKTVPSGFPFCTAQMFRVMGKAIVNNQNVTPNFHHGVKRRLLLDYIQLSSDQNSASLTLE